MPKGDGTGPFGRGPATGRAEGYCTGHEMPGYANALPRGGYGMGFGRGAGRGWGGGGRGWRHRYYATGMPGWSHFGGVNPVQQKADPKIERQTLQNQAEVLQSQLDFIKKRLEEMEKGVGEK